ncbi:MAG TPA: argininosuccinate lyase [Chloroflexota bacterium]|nr:argininosuccinate lyase [Chloroflexota bacterium]
MAEKPDKLWGGRFAKEVDAEVHAFGASISFDRRLFREDIAGSIAHARMLGTQGIIGPEEADSIVRGLEQVRAEVEGGTAVPDLRWEDIHSFVESRLRELIGDVAGKLHTARSRNDQVALDTRLFARSSIKEIASRLAALQQTLLEMAEANMGAVMPGYTHMQRAQPVLLSHHLLAYFEMFQRDGERLRDCHTRTNVLPLGAGALAGVTYPVDRQAVASALGFPSISRNSMDAVADRDYLVEMVADLSLVMAHLSRLAEEVILWSTEEFGFLELDDSYSTGSSIMPQKKNPDVAELVRGKTGRVYGSLVAMLTVIKGLPLTYNKDMQEDKEQLFDAVDTVSSCLRMFSGMLATATFRLDRMRQVAGGGFSTATDVADYLAKAGLPFRQAHEVVGRLVRHCMARGCDITDLSISELRSFSPIFQEDIFSVTVESSVAARDVPGGTAPNRVREALEEGRRLVNANREWAEQG